MNYCFIHSLILFFLFRLRTIHNENFIHRDFHSGNILSLKDNYYKWVIGDLGLSQPANNISLNNEIYGVIPYIAPEIFNDAKFSKASDIYSMGMIMWEFTTGCKPFANVEHNIDLIYNIIDGQRPEITEDTPEFFANLMKKCWDNDPTKRPSISEVLDIFSLWINSRSLELEDLEQFVRAEKKRVELVQLKKIGPESVEKSHPKAIYTSRPLRSLISKSSSINSTSPLSFDKKKGKSFNFIY
jgi:serine/threonine protein kinase